MRKGAILLGGLAQAATVAVLLVAVQPPALVYAVTPAVAGAVGALLSDRFQSKYVEAGGAGLVGTLLSLGTVGAVAWRNTASLPRDFRIDLTLLTVLIGLGALIFLLPLAVMISVVVGHFAAAVRDGHANS